MLIRKLICEICIYPWPDLQVAISTSFEFRFTLFQKRFHAFVFVFTRKHERKEIDFAAQTLIKIRSRSELHRFLGQPQGDGTLLGNEIRDLHRPGLELIRRHRSEEHTSE